MTFHKVAQNIQKCKYFKMIYFCAPGITFFTEKESKESIRREAQHGGKPQQPQLTKERMRQLLHNKRGMPN